MRRSLILISLYVVISGMWDRWWHLAGFAVCCLGWELLRLSAEKRLPGVLKEAKDLDNDLVRHMAEADQVHESVRRHLTCIMCYQCKRLFNSAIQCEEHECGT
jgi:hypothetical protein